MAAKYQVRKGGKAWILQRKLGTGAWEEIEQYSTRRQAINAMLQKEKIVNG